MARSSKKSAADGAGSAGTVSADERHRMVAETAYFKAESRGLEGGSPEQDWLDAEAEVDAKFARKEQRKMRPRPPQDPAAETESV